MNAKRLKNLVFRAIGLVDKGANEEAHIVLAKRDDTEKQDNREDEPMADPVKLPEDVIKALAEATELKKRVEAAETKAKDAESRIAKMEDEKQREVFIAKAKDFSALPGANPDDLGPILRKAYGVWSPEEQTKVETILRGAVKIAQDSALFRELGVPGQGAGADPYSKLETMANALIQKSQTPLTLAQAMAKAEATPEGRALYNQYAKEREDAARRVR